MHTHAQPVEPVVQVFEIEQVRLGNSKLRRRQLNRIVKLSQDIIHYLVYSIVKHT